jgi:TetR/AcrR family transcriptional repressor of nem operon
MDNNLATKQDTRTALLQVGMEIMLEKGYTNTGIQEVLSSLSIPKGSFYHYFDSKETFAVAIIHQFEHDCTEDLIEILDNRTLTPLQRLKTYCEQGKASFESQECRKGCLIGNLSQEMSDQSEVLRKELSLVMARWRNLLAACIAEGQLSGEITNVASAYKIAEFFSSGWGGAVMRAKTMKNVEPMDILIELMFKHLLKP